MPRPPSVNSPSPESAPSAVLSTPSLSQHDFFQPEPLQEADRHSPTPPQPAQHLFWSCKGLFVQQVCPRRRQCRCEQQLVIS
ncbi:uncharacterized protein BKA78DRAFT_324932 [Phyllosticta capitalensis]|uniref:uncharacterized protein n=1 Tax=Phyllosticta capitalensis TaxID=121624 RepID=UPI00312F72D8